MGIMNKWLILLPLTLCLFLGGCTDPIVDLEQSYSYVVSEGFVTFTITDANGKTLQETALATFSITSVTAGETYKDTPFVTVRLADGYSYNLFDITLREFLVLCGEAMGPWMMDIPASQIPNDRSES
jgi:hypothetical protein